MKKVEYFFDNPAHSCSINIEYLLNLPCYVFWKNVDGYYIGYNDYGADRLGLKKEQIIGKTDLDIFPREIALIYRNNDKKIVQFKKQSLFLEDGVMKDNNPVIFSSYKMPIYDQNNMAIGVFGISLTQPLIQDGNLSLPIESSMNFNPISKIITKNVPILSEREIACLNLLSKGLTVKQIAKQFQISPRTIETYLDRVKYKLNCKNKADLIVAFIKLYEVIK